MSAGSRWWSRWGSRWWSRWVALLDRREPATSLAICRIVIGIAVCSHLLWMLWLGVDQLAWTDLASGGMRALEPGWLGHVGGLTPFNIRALTLLTAAAAALMAIGATTTWIVPIVWIGWRTLADLNSHAGGAYDELIKNILLILMVSGCGRALSVDAWRGKTGLVPAWPRYVLSFQLALMYWSCGMQKVSAGWVPGGSADALWYILQQPTWQRIRMEWLAPAYPLTQAATLGTWLFEQSAPLLIVAAWFRDTRTRGGWLRATFNRLDLRSWVLVAGVGMHVGIEATMEVGAFSLASLSLYACFYHPDEWRALGDRLARLRAPPPA